VAVWSEVRLKELTRTYGWMPTTTALSTWIKRRA